MDPIIITLAILGGAVILFFTEIIPMPVTALLVPVALSLFGILEPAEAVSYFGDKWVIIFLAMFMVGEAVFRTGLADIIGRATVRFAGKNATRVLILVMLIVGIMSAFLSNTGTIAVFIPIVLGICRSAEIRPGKILMPMAFAASLGGTMTLIGTPPNGVVNSIISERGLDPFGFFEFAKIGGILFIVGILYYILIGERFLPDSEAESEELFHRDMTFRRNKMWIAIAVFLFVIVMMATELIPLVTAALLGACLMIITRCITMKEAFQSVSWTTIFLFAGMLPMSAAMQSSGAAAMIAEVVISNVTSPWLLLGVIYLFTAVLTNFMSNTATAALMAPIGIAIAVGYKVNPEPILIAIATAASACFLTPIATPPNTIVLGPGGYHFLDYLKAGWLLQIIVAVIGVLVIPLIWKF
jgi:anion transporter